jgi:microcystin-dependent protein
MAGRLVVNTLNTDTVGAVLTTQNGMTGIAKAWVNFNGTLATPITPRSSFNISSITKNSTGNYTLTFTTAMPNTNYCVVGQNEIATSTGVKAATYTTSSVTITTALYTAAAYDTTFNNVAIFSS